MKIGGNEVTKAEEILILERPRADDIVIIAESVQNMSDFDKICPEPKAKPILVKGGFRENKDDPTYRQQMEKWGELKYAFMILQSLKPSNIEWDTVDMDDPSTWTNWDKELRDAGLCDMEIQRIQIAVSNANALNQKKLDDAVESFVRGMAALEAAAVPSGQDTEPTSTQSGTPVSNAE